MTVDAKGFQTRAEVTKKAKFNEYAAYAKGQYLLNDKYRHLSLLQDGSFGKVTLAVNVENNTKVAVKAMYKSNSIRIARHEIEILRKLGNGNEHICQLVDSFETSDFVILILEYCANGDLYDLIHSSANLSAVDIWNIAKELYGALKYAHNLGVYHRDIKPENVLFDAFGRVKLCDWGLSTTVRINNEFNVGTEKYMAPECFISKEGFTEYDSQYADYWSYGITLLTTVFGTSPFKPVGESKSLELDYNFKNFVLLNKSEILYDFYPTMNENCFKIFMNLLKVGGLDSTLSEFKATIKKRDLDKFIFDLEDCWRFGLTIDEEYELEETSDIKDDVFDVDYDDLGLTSTVSSKEETFDSENEGDYEDDFSTYDNLKNIPITPSTNKITANDYKVPSLVECSIETTASKSWCDLDDEDDFDLLLSQLSLSHQKNNLMKNHPLKNNSSITIVEREIIDNANTMVNCLSS